MLDLLAVLVLLWLAGMVLAGVGLGGLHAALRIERVVRGISARMKIQYPTGRSGSK